MGILLISFILIAWALNWVLESLKDVSDVYLSSQSLIEVTRLENESAVYKSNKLDLNLRMGLDIRYDHYKLRNGNLCDIWELLINHAKRNPTKSLRIFGRSVLVSELNYKIHCLGKFFISENIKKVGVPIENFLSSEISIIIMLTCFLHQINVNFYDSPELTNNIDLFINEKDKCNSLFLDAANDRTIFKYISEGKSLDFENVYSPVKDKGILLTFTRRESAKVQKTTSFTQLNLVSGIASTLKHLSPEDQIRDTDNIVIVPPSFNTSNDLMINALVKILISFIVNADLTVGTFMSWKEIEQTKPTILNAAEHDFLSLFEFIKRKNNLGTWRKIIHYLKCRFLERGIFWNIHVIPSSLRLIYLNKCITGPNHLSIIESNEIRSLLNSRLVREFGFENVVGPVILTDYYDYRVITTAKPIKAYGCTSQSLEIKLIEYDKVSGFIAIRGYSIGKMTKKMIGMHEVHHDKNAQDNGFMPVREIRGKFGTDGCLYVYK